MHYQILVPHAIANVIIKDKSISLFAFKKDKLHGQFMFYFVFKKFYTIDNNVFNMWFIAHEFLSAILYAKHCHDIEIKVSYSVSNFCLAFASIKI